MVGLEPTIPCARNTWACRYPTSRSKVRTAGFEPAFSWSPTKRDARLRRVLMEYPVGESNPNPTGIRSPSACPLDGAVCARTCSAKWAGRRSNPRLLVFSQALHRLSYQPNKKPDVACDTGFRLIPKRVGQASQAERMRGLRIRRFIGEPPITHLRAYEA